MKTIISTLCFMLLSLVGFAQTKEKASLLNKFSKERGIEVISNWAHPLSTCHKESVEIRISSGSVYIKIPYTKGSRNFSCKYCFTINSSDYISSLLVINEGYSTYPCFSTCDAVNSVMAKIDIYKGDNELVEIVEKIINKTADNFTCKDYCLLGLNYYWVNNGYRSTYRGSK